MPAYRPESHDESPMRRLLRSIGECSDRGVSHVRRTLHGLRPPTQTEAERIVAEQLEQAAESDEPIADTRRILRAIASGSPLRVAPQG